MQIPGNDWTHTGVKHNKTRSALIRDDAVRKSGVTGPLGVGLVLQSEPFLIPTILTITLAALPVMEPDESSKDEMAD